MHYSETDIPSREEQKLHINKILMVNSINANFSFLLISKRDLTVMYISMLPVILEDYDSLKPPCSRLHLFFPFIILTQYV